MSTPSFKQAPADTEIPAATPAEHQLFSPDKLLHFQIVDTPAQWNLSMGPSVVRDTLQIILATPHSGKFGEIRLTDSAVVLPPYPQLDTDGRWTGMVFTPVGLLEWTEEYAEKPMKAVYWHPAMTMAPEFAGSPALIQTGHQVTLPSGETVTSAGSLAYESTGGWMLFAPGRWLDTSGQVVFMAGESSEYDRRVSVSYYNASLGHMTHAFKGVNPPNGNWMLVPRDIVAQHIDAMGELQHEYGPKPGMTAEQMHDAQLILGVKATSTTFTLMNSWLETAKAAEVDI